MEIALFLAGTKGANFLRSFHEGASVIQVVSYRSRGLCHDPCAEIQDICKARGYKYCDRDDVSPTSYSHAHLIFMIGWQWLLPEIDPRFIVLHDSLLPRFRGFSPTVTALILGETHLGVTAFKPDTGTDSGLICGQKEILVHYPVTIREIYDRLGIAYVELVRQIIEEYTTGSLKFYPQRAEEATFSLWRDEADYQIDWNSSADSIVRYVDALGHPYLGAKTILQGREIRIDRVEVTSDVVFEYRQPSKIWSITNNIPTVVCGSGMLKILDARENEGGAVRFDSLRVRLGI